MTATRLVWLNRFTFSRNSRVIKRTQILKIVNNPPYRNSGWTSDQSGYVIKMWCTNIYSKIILYQKYLGTSIKVDCATHSLYASSRPKAEGVPTNNQRGRGSGPCRLWEGIDKTRHIVPTALFVRVQCLRNGMYKAVEGTCTRLMVLSMISGSYLSSHRAQN